MLLPQLLRTLNQSFPVTHVAPAIGRPDITQVQLENQAQRPLPSHIMILKLAAPSQVQLSYYRQGQLCEVGLVTLGAIGPNAVYTQNQLLKLLFCLGKLVASPAKLQAQANQLAIAAITADFETVLARVVALLQNPVAIIDLNGQILSRSHTTAINGGRIRQAIEHNKVGQWLLEHGFAPDNPDFLTQIYVAQDNISFVPMLITPLANQDEPLGYLVMSALNTPLDAKHALLINDLGQVVAGSLVKNQIMSTSESQRDLLLNVLLTERQSTTFAAQFAEQQVKLPHTMVLIKCDPLAGQSPTVLQQRLRYLLTPQFDQVLVSVYQQSCLALVTISLAAYNQPEFKAKLATVTAQADCRLIVSNYYVQPEDTFAAYMVCCRTSQLKTIQQRVVFCEDEFFNLSLARVNHLEILPFFINPALQGLMAYDAQNQTDLVATLDAYLKATCNLTRTAKQLYVHPNTLRNRLKHISAITGCDLRDADTCFKLASGFKLERFLVKNNYQPTPFIPDNDPMPPVRPSEV
ncbi:PucR family transcriptional regulator [Lactiplantibacillus daowaiensis]|uniref:PucR family transcriptional regulator n=1 Tax=Lactiplantibacillus daowaiensis TaxID=2559918 RepID=A0ABW1RZ55_9LACO|nr:helix-turn-helix domain-containing protein [Lactiplantibacillus daowaiensis]